MYFWKTSTSRTAGKAQIKDGSLILTGTGGSGRLGVSPRTSTAWIGERGGILVLSGSGRDDIGPFNFEFTKDK